MRREDGELCGFVEERHGRWRALTVFGATLCDTDDEQAARRVVLMQGLASLARRWELRARCEQEWQTVCIQEVSPHHIRIALGYYSLPGSPATEIAVDDIRSGEFELRLREA